MYGKRRFWIFLIGLLFIIIGLYILYSGVSCGSLIAKCQLGDNQLIGGDKDEYGCLIAAGYTWCETKQKCLREWEEECVEEIETEKEFIPAELEAIGVAEGYAKNLKEFKEENGRNIKIIELIQHECVGCWKIEVEFDLDPIVEGADLDKMNVVLSLDSWSISDTTHSRSSIVLKN